MVMKKAKQSVLDSMKKLKTEYLDLVLLHQPFGDHYGAYRALQELYKEGKNPGDRCQQFLSGSAGGYGCV